MKKLLLIILFSFSLSTISYGVDIIKKSSSGICHDKKSSWYEKTKNFKPYKTIKECLDSGGRLPKK